MECVFEDAYVLITDHEIVNLSHIEGILKRVVAERIPLLVIGQLSPQVAATINMNVIEKKIRFCNIIPPSMGYRKDELMEDIAVSLGGHYYSQATGDNLALCTFDGLGKAKKIIIGQDSTVIIPDEEYIEKSDVQSHVADLKMLIEEEKDESYINFLNERIANISGGIGIIYVGADSDIEQKELRDRVDDAVLAVKAAIDEGILPGGGISLINAMSKVKNGSTTEREIAYNIMSSVVKSPLYKICTNAGVDPEECYNNIVFNKDGYGYDVKNEKYGDMIKMGIIDPAKVTKNAIKNAVSVATTILSTNAIITNVRENESVE
jgi:chaperonin GroEL